MISEGIDVTNQQSPINVVPRTRVPAGGDSGESFSVQPVFPDNFPFSGLSSTETYNRDRYNPYQVGITICLAAYFVCQRNYIWCDNYGDRICLQNHFLSKVAKFYNEQSLQQHSYLHVVNEVQTILNLIKTLEERKSIYSSLLSTLPCVILEYM